MRAPAAPGHAVPGGAESYRAEGAGALVARRVERARELVAIPVGDDGGGDGEEGEGAPPAAAVGGAVLRVGSPARLADVAIRPQRWAAPPVAQPLCSPTKPRTAAAAAERLGQASASPGTGGKQTAVF